MADETVRQDENTEGKVFTQAELDSIVGERLSRERSKYADYDALKEKAQKLDEIEDANKTELQKMQEHAQSLQKELDALKKAASVRQIRDDVARETGVPVDLLTYDTEEECKAQAERLKAWNATPGTYPEIRDGGEPQNPPKSKKSTRELFADAMKDIR